MNAAIGILSRAADDVLPPDLAGAHLLPTSGGDLASQLLAAFATLLAGREAAAVILDEPARVDAAEVNRALALLADADVVFVPAPDGGYRLVAMTGRHDLFTGVALGTSVALSQTVARAQSLGLRVAVLDAPGAADAARPLVRRIHLEITNRCPSHCATCARTFAPPAASDLSVADIERLLDQMPSVRTAALQVNGEPLVAPHLAEVLACLARRGVASELNTGGALLDGALAEMLLESPLRGLNISLDAATRATYRAHRGDDDFDKVVANVERFLVARRARGRGPRVSLWMVATRRNLAEFSDLVRLAARLGADEVMLQRLVLHGSGLGTPRFSVHGRLTDADRAILDEAAEIGRATGVAVAAAGGGTPTAMLEAAADPRPFTSCRRPWESAVIMADGEVVPCCIGTFLPGRDLSMGNALGEGFAAVFEGPRYQAFRDELRAGTEGGPCTSCGVRWSL